VSTATDRQTFRATLAVLVDKTKAKLPALNGRVEKACRLVLQGDVELHDDGTALVNSMSDPTRAYQCGNGVCQCRDWGQAPEHLCCHRLAVGFQRKVEELAPEGPQEPAAVCSAPPLPEAPASANVRVTIAGREVQITLRDHDEARLLARLAKVLEGYPLPEQPARPPLAQLSPEQHNAMAMHRPITGVCAVHGVQMQQHTNAKGSWFSHYVDGRHCKGKGVRP
jgi:hypothetical protein